MPGPFTAFVSWPSAPLTDSLVRRSLAALTLPPTIVDSPPSEPGTAILQWSTYDAIAHDLTLHAPSRVLASSYAIRKALIRKHFLARCVHAYTTKQPASVLKNAVPASWDIELSFADELEDMWADELYELQERMLEGRWWILKPGMADRGMGIRLFGTREELERIFEGFDEGESDEEGDGNGTSVATSQLRHFVIQEYIPNPLLLDPGQIPFGATAPKLGADLEGYKFHLRAYCVASGALKLYLYTRVLALFSGVPYQAPQRPNDDGEVDLTPHLTNTSLQTHRGEEGVRLLDELVGCQILSGSSGNITEADVQGLKDQMAHILAETFRAAMAMPVHFQALPNAFELYGVDFLVSDDSVGGSRFGVHLLEVNSEPAIELTGPRLTWILEDLFVATGKVCVEPFFSQGKDEVDATAYHLRKCLEMDVGYR